MKYTHFSSDERLEISILLKRGYSGREIGSALGKHHSSVSREIKYNSVHGVYDPRRAQHKATVKRSNSKYQGMKIVSCKELRAFVHEGMERFHTPEQIAGRWNRRHADHDKTTITHHSIYKYLYSPYGNALCAYLPSRHYRKKKRKTKTNTPRIRIKNRISIDQRPSCINERKRFGDFEADTLGHIVSDREVVTGITERQSRYFLVTKVPQLKYAMDGFKALLNPYRNILQSVTFDNGVENTRHEELSADTYFCHAYSSWEKGTMENTFGRLRRFVPKKSSLKNFSVANLQGFANIMNHTPRKCLNWRTPHEVFTENSSLLLSSLPPTPLCRT